MNHKTDSIYMVLTYIDEQISINLDKMRDYKKRMAEIDPENDDPELTVRFRMEDAAIDELRTMVEWIRDEFPEIHQRYGDDHYSGPIDVESGSRGTAL